MKLNAHIKNNIVIVICYLFVLLFVYAAVSKLLDFNTFQNQLGQSPLLSAYAHWVVWAVPISEILIAILLCINRFRMLGLYGFYGLMVMFTTYIVIILNFTSFTPCSCGGVLEELGWTEHLIFNIVFVVLSGISILFLSAKKSKTLLKLFILTIFSIIIVTIIFLSSEKQIKRNNAFIRRYMPHPIEKIGEYDLEYDSYYLTGLDDTTIYLGNYNAPLFMMSLNTSLTQTNEFRVAIDSTHLPYRRVRISVNPPYFYLGDGTVPVLFKGKISEWDASVFSYYDAYFTEFVVADSVNVGITTKSSITRSDALGLLKKTNDTIRVALNHDVLTKQTDGVFESNGILLWNDTHQRFIYTYYYRNSYEVTDKNLSYQFTGKTIDTISRAVLDIAHYAKTDIYKLGGKSIMVNRQSATYGDYLYINSDRLGRYEGEEVLRSAGIIDVYDITDNTYVFSFYLYHQPDKKLSEFRVYKDLLVAIVDNKLWLYRLKPEYFNSGSNAKHTVQFQEEDRTPVEKSRSQIK